MTCINELQLEIGENNFWPIISEPELSDTLSSHGQTCSIQIRVNRNSPLPQEGELAFLTRKSISTSQIEKVFGGICGQVTPKLGISFDTVSLTLNNFTEYVNRKDIENYRRTDLLAGHIRQGAVLAGCLDVPDVERQLLDVFTLPDSSNNEPFLFEYQRGKFSTFLDNLCSLKNCSWIIEDTGVVLISNLTNVNARLFVRSNIYLNNPAPKSTLSIPNPGTTVCPSSVFWQPGLTYTPIPPEASVIRVFGRNGKQIYGATTQLNPDILRYRAENGRTQYPLSQTADETLQIKITLPSMTTFYLDKQIFDPLEPVPPDGSFEARIRAEERQFYCSAIDVPADSLIEVISKTNFIYYELENQSAITIIKSVDQAGDGKVYFDIDDPNITDMATAIQAAEQASALMCAINYQLNFSVFSGGTRVLRGWKSGQQLRLIHSARNINVLVTIQDVKRKLIKGGRDLYTIASATIQIYKPESLTDMLIEKVNNPASDRLVIFTPGTGV